MGKQFNMMILHIVKVQMIVLLIMMLILILLILLMMMMMMLLQIVKGSSSADYSAAVNDADANAVHTPNDDNDVVADCEGKFKRLWRRFIPRASSSTSRGQKMGLILHRHYLNLHDHHAYNPHDDHHHFHIAGHPDAFKCNRRQTLNMDLISLLIFILIIILRSP